ncbi:ATP/GTP-binding protein [Streptomyces kronopolitis]|uniref:ATP/GTP-binding protein n=1 Tax=Streptomyces kronopolitis TaxID=1612435 RepID=UPI0036B44203
MLRRAAAAAPLAAALALVAAGPVWADGRPGPGHSVAPPHDCGMSICLGAGVDTSETPRHETKAPHQAHGSGRKPVCKVWGDGGRGSLNMGRGAAPPAEVTVPCHDSEMGSFSGGCYYKPVSPPPPASDPVWKGHAHDKGAIYNRTCPGGSNEDPFDVNGAGMVWMAKPPAAAAVDPVQLALRAVDKMKLAGPDIVSPQPGGTFTVGVPVWMHVGQTPTTFGPNKASASAGGLTVTALARVESIRWSMGDGTSVVCRGPGAPYRASAGLAESPDCGHLYAKTSRAGAGERFTVRATATWRIDWTGGGQGGQLTRTRASQVRVAVGEVQAVGR